MSEPADCALTETVLIQTSPLRMSAHLAVMESLMMLFIREQAPPSRVLSAVRRYSKTEDLPADSEEALMFWINQSCQAVRYPEDLSGSRKIRRLTTITPGKLFYF